MDIPGAFLLLFAGPLLWVNPSSAGDCQMISIDAGCSECTYNGHCVPGSVPVDSWTSYALYTQRELQLDIPFNHVSFLDAHNAYNNRADGYGRNDTCSWPPPYQQTCIGFANQEFSMTDMLNMGIRGVEMDNWYCKGDMRLAHLSSNNAFICQEDDRLYSETMKEIGDWLDKEENARDIIRIYINEKQEQGHDDLMNGPIEAYLGRRVLTPSDLNDTYKGEWPTLRRMRQDGKNVVIATGSTAGSGELYTHGDIYIHKLYWSDRQLRRFTPYPECGGKTDDDAVRYYSDSTHYPLFYDGPTDVGVIQDFWELLRCRIQFPAGDHVNPALMKTAVFTWAEGEPSQPLTESSCIVMSGVDSRWYIADCDSDHYYACQHVYEPNEWTVTDGFGPYTITKHVCPPYYRFSAPQNGYQYQKLIEASRDQSVWINFSPWLPNYVDPQLNFLTTIIPSSAVRLPTLASSWLYLVFIWVFNVYIWSA